MDSACLKSSSLVHGNLTFLDRESAGLNETSATHIQGTLTDADYDAEDSYIPV